VCALASLTDISYASIALRQSMEWLISAKLEGKRLVYIDDTGRDMRLRPLHRVPTHFPVNSAARRVEHLVIAMALQEANDCD